MLLKVGELAKRTGLTVRTLHHYDAIGLLTPSARSEAGYRLYNNADIARLHSIQGLRNLGFQLSDIDHMLAANGATLPEILSRQLNALDQEIARATDLRSRLSMLQNSLLVGGQPETNDWLMALELMTTHGKYFTAAELKTISENWKQMESEWKPLIQEVGAAMKSNFPVGSRDTQVLARRWMDLSMRWMKDDLALLKRWGDMCRKDPVAHGQSGVDSESFQYISKAIDLRVTAFKKYLHDDEIKRLNKNMDKEWASLEKTAQKVMRQKLSVESDEARQLLARWNALVDQATDHDPVIREKLLIAMRSEPLLQAGTHLSAKVGAFIYQTHVADKEKTLRAN